VCNIPAPLARGKEPERPPSARSCHWLPSGPSLALIVSYAHYGVICYEVPTATVLWRIPTRNGAIGRSSLSPCNELLAIHNIAAGFDVYRIDTRKRISTFRYQPSQYVSLPVLFLHGGKALLTGSDVGRVRVYDIATTLQVDQLNHSNVVLYLILIPVQASFTGQRRRIATGSSETGEATYIKLW
ncbi:hypothetical protein FOMPIDRAFT_1107525, partial [Fomitopsis schrenkii]